MNKNNIVTIIISFISIVIFVSACSLFESPAYTVTYNSSGHIGGTVPVDTKKYETGETVRVKDNTGNLVCPGYFFSGWNTQSDMAGSHYDPGNTFGMGEHNVTLYAEWVDKVPVHMITFTGNGGTGTMAFLELDEGETINLPPNTFTWEGFVFDRWADLPSLQSGVPFHEGNSLYSAAAAASRDKLINDYNWTITDGGPELGDDRGKCILKPGILICIIFSIVISCGKAPALIISMRTDKP